MDLSLNTPIIDTFDVYSLTAGSTHISEIKSKALSHTIDDYTYYLFKDKQGLLCLFVQDNTIHLQNQKVFSNITRLPYYTNTNKVECLFLLEVVDSNGLYTARMFI